MQLDETLSDDPVEIVKFLIRENGLDRARQIALEGTTVANEEGDFYRLSIWREVKLALRDWTEEDSSEIRMDEIAGADVTAADVAIDSDDIKAPEETQ